MRHTPTDMDLYTLLISNATKKHIKSLRLFLKGSTKLARYHDLTSGSGIALIESEDPSLVIEFTNGWSELCESTITPVVNDKKAMAILTKK